MSLLSKEEKERLLKTLEEDREFRYSLMGLLGFKEVLDRITRIEEKIVEILKRQQKLEERQLKLEERQQKLEERIARVEKEITYVRRLSELNRRDLSALTEALYSRWILEDVKTDITSRGEKILNIYRAFLIDNMEIDLVIETDRCIYVIEVKIQPNHHDIDDLVRKVEIVRTKIGKEAKPILACTWIGKETAQYAKNKGVAIFVY